MKNLGIPEAIEGDLPLNLNKDENNSSLFGYYWFIVGPLEWHILVFLGGISYLVRGQRLIINFHNKEKSNNILPFEILQ